MSTGPFIPQQMTTVDIHEQKNLLNINYTFQYAITQLTTKANNLLEIVNRMTEITFSEV